MTLTGKRLDFPSPPRRKAPLGAWPAFERKLAETLGALEEDQYLVVSAKRGWAYVQFAAQGSFGLRAECVGNNYLDEAHALSAGQMALLRRIGWSSPTGDAWLPELLPGLRPAGSVRRRGRMAVRALTEVFEIPHPGSLMYKAFDKKHRTILVPTLGLKREEPAPPPEKPREDTVEGLRKLVLEAIREGSGNTDLGFTRDGDVALRFGSAAVYVRVLDDPPCVRMFSPVLEDVEADDRLLDRLNELNAEMRLARFFVVEGRVIVAAEMFVAPFVAEHVKRACVVVGSLADEFGGMLQKEFGGRRAFEEGGRGGVQ
ncbi:MAG: YbjN domain-containing protein [Acidobacteria bacterium]|nr:YbjN domain-containing protein [Acidobacteriota bacterium]